MRPLWKMLFLLVILILFLPPRNSYPSNPTQGAKAAAMGTAVVAIADEPSAIAHNPAGLTKLKGTHIYGGATGMTILSTFESPQGGSEKTRFQIFIPPHMYICSDLGFEDMAFGFGIFSPFGIGGRKWPDTGLTRFVSTESLIATVDANPTFAWSPLAGVSLGVGVDYIYALCESEKKLDQSVFSAPDGSFESKGDGGGWGFNLGALYAISDKVSLGAAYRSRVNVRQKGKVNLKDIAPPLQPLFGGNEFATDAETTLHFPNIVSIGVAFRPTKEWTIGLDVEWTDWSRFSKSCVDIVKEVPAAGFTDVSVDSDWGTSWFFKFGMEHALTERISLRGGYLYVDTPVPDWTLSPDNPDSDQHNLTCGLGYKFEKYVIDTFYSITFFADREVTNPILSGKYENIIHAAGFSLGYRF